MNKSSCLDHGELASQDALPLRQFYQAYGEMFQMAGEEALEGMQSLQDILHELEECCVRHPKAGALSADFAQQVTHAGHVCQQVMGQIRETVMPLLETLNLECDARRDQHDQPLVLEKEYAIARFQEVR
jgi:hypothetical protein